ncbi:hypothetical protein N9V31_00010 [Candidatus Poseidonia alphae]|nr:hypothetical protein [Candidatus Poseidonia alphae]
MNDEDGAPTTPKEKPFFDIEHEPSESALQQPPPSGIVMGQVAAQPASEPTSQIGATQSSLGAPQLSGQVNAFTHGGQQFAQIQPQNVGFRWGQFFLGFIVPWGVLIASVFLVALIEESNDYDQFIDFQTYSMTPNEDGWFVQSISVSSGENLDWIYGCCLNESDGRLGIQSVRDYNGMPGDMSIGEEYFNESSGYYDSAIIGNYTLQNQTLWFKPSQSNVERLTVEVQIHDHEGEEKYWQNEQDYGETVFCLLPFIYIGSVVAAFVRGNKALGIGLLSAIPGAIIFFPLLFFLLLISFGF